MVAFSMSKNMVALFLIILAAWVLIFLGSFIIFKLVVPIPDFEGFGGAMVSAVLKALLATSLVLLWIFILIKLRDAYVKSRLLG